MQHILRLLYGWKVLSVGAPLRLSACFTRITPLIFMKFGIVLYTERRQSKLNIVRTNQL
jgi:hypothetical protein